MAHQTARQFFQALGSRGPRGLRASYRFDLEEAGSWRVEVDDGAVSVEESTAAADCVVKTSERTFLRIVRGDQDPLGAYMSGKVRLEGEAALALRLRELLG
jgi:putative sterol carrier protein